MKGDEYVRGYWRGRDIALAFLEGRVRDGACAEEALVELRKLTISAAPREMIPSTHPILLGEKKPQKQA